MSHGKALEAGPCGDSRPPMWGEGAAYVNAAKEVIVAQKPVGVTCQLSKGHTGDHQHKREEVHGFLVCNCTYTWPLTP